MNRLVKQGFLATPGRSRERPGRSRTAGGRIGGASTDGWELAVALAERWLATGARVDALLEQLMPGLPGRERARAQHLFYGVVRWRGRIEAALSGLMQKPPRTRVRAVLLVVGFELLEQGVVGGEKPDVGDEQAAGGKGPGTGVVAKIVHHAVEAAKVVASPREAALVNAVARRMAGRMPAAPGTIAEEFSHPDWLVARWERQFGPEATRRLLAWNQTPARVFVRWRRHDAGIPDFLQATRWAGFLEVRPGHWDEVRRLAEDGSLFIQDPSTRLAIELLGAGPGESILDACAAPGGKSVYMADMMVSGRVVAVDLPARPGEPGIRLDRLKENLGRAPAGVAVSLMPADLRRAGPRFFKDHGLPETYDAVLLDAPCSNTGVMRHRVDVKWRLQEGDFSRHAAQQFALLRAVARFVRPGGRLVYSTCSIDTEENEDVARRFAREYPGWKAEGSSQGFPWVDGHDGASAFLFRRK